MFKVYAVELSCGTVRKIIVRNEKRDTAREHFQIPYLKRVQNVAEPVASLRQTTGQLHRAGDFLRRFTLRAFVQQDQRDFQRYR